MFIEVPSESVVAMATGEGLSFRFWIQNITYITSGKIFSSIVVSEVYLKNHAGGGGGDENTPSPIIGLT